MEEISTIELIKLKTEELSVDTGKFYKGNNSAGTRARKLAQELNRTLFISDNYLELKDPLDSFMSDINYHQMNKNPIIIE